MRKFSLQFLRSFLFLSLLYSSPVFSQTLLVPPKNGYHLVELENDHFQTYTIDEFTKMIGDDSSLLNLLKCNGVSENNLFTEPVKLNLKHDSLKIRITDEVVSSSDLNTTFTLYTYREGKIFNQRGKEKKKSRFGFLGDVLKSLNELESLPSGRKLLRLLEVAPYEITLKKGVNRFSPLSPLVKENPSFAINLASTVLKFITLRKDRDLPLFQIGTGGNVNWDPSLQSEFIESDGVRRQPGSVSISLAHELFHAFDSVRGVLDRRLVEGKEYESSEASEYRAAYFENLIRKELGLKYRKFYGTPNQPENEPDLLTAEGEPIFIPTACL